MSDDSSFDKTDAAFRFMFFCGGVVLLVFALALATVVVKYVILDDQRPAAVEAGERP